MSVIAVDCAKTADMPRDMHVICQTQDYGSSMSDITFTEIINWTIKYKCDELNLQLEN